MARPTIMPDSAPDQPYKHWLIKLLDCVFVGIAVVDFYDSLIMYPATFLPNRDMIMRILAIGHVLLIYAAIFFVVIYPIRWHRREKRHPALDSALRHAWLTGLIRYWLAAVILNYGFAKFFGTQFAPNYFRGDSTWSSLPGYDLTWNYFGYSYVMSTIIGVIQVVGCCCLFFRRTTMLGIILLLPVMVNVSLIDIFYNIQAGATYNAIVFTAALMYLLALQWPAIRLRIGKNVLRLALTAWAFGFIAWISSSKAPSALTGKWRVDQLVRNGRTYAPDAWVTDSLDWKYLYLEEFGRATFSPNPLVVDPRSMLATYKFDATSQSIHFKIFSRPLNRDAADTATVKLVTTTPGHMNWHYLDGNDTVDLSLTRVPPAKARAR